MDSLDPFSPFVSMFFSTLDAADHPYYLELNSKKKALPLIQALGNGSDYVQKDLNEKNTRG